MSTRLVSGPMEISWDPSARVASIRYAPDTSLAGREATALIEAIGAWIGTEGKPFALLADAKGVRGSDAEYRSKTTAFYRRHGDRICISIFNVGPLIRVMTELFRIGSGVPVKTFADEASARAWLHDRGFPA